MTRPIDPHGETEASDGDESPALDRTLTDAGAARAPTSEDELVGEHLAHFRIDERIGRGGMGEVYRAWDLALDRPVAIKLLDRRIAEDPDLRDRFYREARAQARLNHPNVCHIYFIGDQDGQVFFAMEYVEGESLAEKLERDGALDPDDALEYARQAALGLRAAQARGFTHRDVKPSNLMVDAAGTVKLVDFGLVSEMPEARETASGHSEIGATTRVGTPLYMAPEQAQGKKVDHRADIYALGVTLHHLVAGRPPFSGTTAMEIFSQHLAEHRPRLQPHRRGLAGAAPIDRLCDRMMAKKRDERFTDYDDLLRELERISPRRTRPAGFWVRASAAFFDLMAVALMSLPFQLVLPVEGNALVVPMAVVYYLFCHARFGRTIGKYALEIELIDVDTGRRPRPLQVARRFLVQWGPACAAFAAGEALDRLEFAIEWIAPTVQVLAVIAFLLVPLQGLLAARLVADKRTIWDRMAGTMVRYRRSDEVPGRD